MNDSSSPPSTPAASLDRWEGDPHFMRSLARGLLVLGIVVRGQGRPVSARQAAAATGLSLAAAQRCIYTLNALGYVQANRNGAVCGPALADLATHYAASSPIISACGPALDALHKELGLTVSLTMFEGEFPIVVASRTSDSLLRLEMPVGATMPLHSSSAGKLYLSSLAESDLEERLAQIVLKPHTPHTIVSASALRKQVSCIRKQGYAISDQELMVGLRSASVAVRDARGTARGSVNVAMLAPAISLRDLRGRLIPALARTAGDLSRFLP